MAVRPSESRTLAPLPPTVSGNMLFAKIIPVLTDFMGFLKDHEKALGKIYYAELIGLDICVVTDPEMAEHVLVKNHRNYRKSYSFDVLKLFLGNGLLTSDGDYWRRQRRLAQPAFHRKKLAILAQHMVDEARTLAVSWSEKAKEKESFDVMEDMMGVTINIVAKGLFSTDVGDDIKTISRNLEKLNQFTARRIRSVVRFPMWMPTLRHLVFQQNRDELNDVLSRIVKARRKDSSPPMDLLTMLMEATDLDTGEKMEDVELRDECKNIFVAGHETSALSMTWLWYELSQHPKVMAKLQLELKTVLGERPPEIEDIPRLLYTRMVINEILRLYPPIWIFGRNALEDDTIGGYYIPRGTNVLLFTHSIHRCADLWERPDDFWPERWETEQVKSLPKMAYFPFGGGPRKCMGNNFALMEMSILTATLAQQFTPRYVGDEAPGIDPLISLRPKGKIEIVL